MGAAGAVARLGDLSMARRSEWVDRLFARLSASYGARFSDMWAGLDLAVVKSVWADDLSDLTTVEVARGVEQCRVARFPPTLPEFLSMCRPGLEPEAAFAEAVRQMALRDQGRDAWSHPAIYWAAATIGGFELRNAAWVAIKGRWSRLLAAELAKGEWPAVPVRCEALPGPGQVSADPARVGRLVAGALRKSMEVGDRSWVARIEAKAAAGDAVPFFVKTLVEDLTGVPLLRGGAHAARPDCSDLAAADDSFDAVPI